MPETNELQSVSRPSLSGTVSRLIIFLHGYGADHHDLISLADVLGPRLPYCAFVSACAPEPCEVGFGRQWFSLADRSPAVLVPRVAEKIPLVNRFIDGQAKAHGLASRDVALVGFSQGTMMSLAAGLSRPDALGGIVGFSGALATQPPYSGKPPVLLVHGEADDIVPFGMMAQATSALKSAGVAVESIARPGLGHSIDRPGLEAASRFLDKIWG
jgi:phospholipase/carboxylesterase